MARIEVTRCGSDTYSVAVHENGGSSVHEVTASPEVVGRYGGSATAERLLEASFEFLLEREPKEAILARFDLPVIERYFPEYPREIRKRLG